MDYMGYTIMFPFGKLKISFLGSNRVSFSKHAELMMQEVFGLSMER